MRINSNYNTEKKYRVYAQNCARAGMIAIDAPDGDTREMDVETAIESLKAIKGQWLHSGDLFAWRCAQSVLRAAYLD